MSNGDKPPGAVKNITQVLDASGNIVGTPTVIDIPCEHVAPDAVAKDVETAVQKVAKRYS